MSLLLSSPQVCQVDLCCEWLKLKDFGHLDSSLTNRTLRKKFLSLSQLPHFNLVDFADFSDVDPLTYFNWTKKREFSVGHLPINNTIVEEIMRNEIHDFANKINGITVSGPMNIEHILRFLAKCPNLFLFEILDGEFYISEHLMLVFINNPNICTIILNSCTNADKALFMTTWKRS